MPEDVTDERIVSLDDGVIASAPYIAESNISKQTEIDKEEYNDGKENSIEDSFYQRKGKPSRSKV